MAEPKFVIQGQDYPVPALETFTMGEHEILYQKTGMAITDMDDTSEIKFTPGLLATLMEVAYLRGNPGARRATVEKIVAAVPMLDALEHFGGDEDADAVPPAPGRSENETPASPESRSDLPPSSGEDSESGSAGSREPLRPVPSGTPGSATAQVSDQEISAA